MLPVDSVPATTQSVTDARPGPTVDGAPLRPGDVLVDAGGRRRVVTETGLGAANDAVGLFDPVDGRVPAGGRDGRIDERSCQVAWRNLGTVTGLSEDGDRRLLVTAGYDPERGRYAWAWGRGPVAALAVPLQPVAEADTVIALRQSLAPPFPDGAAALLSALCAERPPLLERLRSRVTTGSEQRADALTGGECRVPSGRTTGASIDRSQPSLWTTAVRIPTGQEPAVPVPADGAPIRPGDRVVYWDSGPPAAPLSAGRDVLAAGHCRVVLPQSSGGSDGRIVCYDLSTGTHERFDPAGFAEIHDRATRQGLVCRLLARDCFVDPIGTEQTYSVHVYALTGGLGASLLLAGVREPTTTPRLEHPLALPTRTYPDLDTLGSALRGSRPLEHPLSEWATEHEAVAAMRERVADRIEHGERRRSLSVE